MLQPADVLLLDEPTKIHNPTLRLGGEPLEFRGSLVLVTHDRYLLDRVSTIVLGLDGKGSAASFGDYSQWETWRAESKRPSKAEGSSSRASTPAPFPALTKKKLSYLEAREYAGIEQAIADAEQILQAKRAQLEDPAIASDGPRLVAAHAEMEAAQKDRDTLYARWVELEEKNG
jgi:ATP-binding cassette subfamily F protein uup